MLSSITKWVSDTYTDWTKTSSTGQNFAGFLADPLGTLATRGLDYAKGRATDYLKSTVEQRFNLSQKMGTTGMPQYQNVSAASAQSSIPSYSKFTSQQAQIPGMRVPQIRNAYDNLYNNSEQLRVPNVQLTVQYTRPNIAGSSSTISLGSSQVSKQKIKTTTKSALSRT